jgi:error-prone DNA polymerase
MLDPQVEKLLAWLARAGGPSYAEMGAAAARAHYDKVAGALDIAPAPVHSVEDLAVPLTGRTLRVRHYVPREHGWAEPMPALLADARFSEPDITLAPLTEGETIVADYAALGIPMGRHPLALLREALNAFQVKPASVLRGYPDGRLARASGLVTHRQRPETARGVVFITLEDDTGTINVIVWPDLLERYRKEILGSRLMTVFGVWQADVATGGQVMHLVARRVVDHTPMLGELTARSRDFR